MLPNRIFLGTAVDSPPQIHCSGLVAIPPTSAAARAAYSLFPWAAALALRLSIRRPFPTFRSFCRRSNVEIPMSRRVVEEVREILWLAGVVATLSLLGVGVAVALVVP